MALDLLKTASDHSISYPCDSCQFHGTEKEASNFCKSCKEYLCRNCTEWHKRFRATRNHKIIRGKDQIKKDETADSDIIVSCLCDQGLEASFYCDEHDDVICQTCKTLKHRNCQIFTVKAKSSGYIKSKLSLVLQRAEELKRRTENFIRDRKPELEQLS